MVRAEFPWVLLIETGENLGFSKGNNIGIRTSRGKYIALINSDVNVFSGCLDSLVDYMDTHLDAGMVGRRLYYGDRLHQSNGRRFPNLWNNTCEVFRLNKLFPKSRFFAGEHMFYFSYDCTAEVEILVGCFILARREAIDDFGLLDEDFFMYSEDLDWGQRCRAAGWKVMFHPTGEAIHYGGSSSSNQPSRFAVAQLRSRRHLLKKHCGPITRAGLLFLMLLQCLIRLVGSAIIWLIRPRRRAVAGSRVASQLACIRSVFRGLATSS